MTITTVIIDDQQDSIDDLLYLVEKHKLPINILATAKSGSEGLVAILKHKPQLVFLDIVMPGMSGFEMLDLLPGLDFHLIVTTSVDKYAIQAIRASALDFLLKPVNPEELKDAISRVIEKSTPPTVQQLNLLHDSINDRTNPIKKIALPVSGGIELIAFDDIMYFESAGNYTTVYLTDKKEIVVTRQLGKFEDIVDPNVFYRVHHSFLVNVSHIIKAVRSDGGYIVLKNNKTINIARSRKEAFFEFISKL